MSDNLEVKACPRCNSNAHKFDECDKSGSPFTYVACTDCGSEGPLVPNAVGALARNVAVLVWNDWANGTAIRLGQGPEA